MGESMPRTQQKAGPYLRSRLFYKKLQQTGPIFMEKFWIGKFEISKKRGANEFYPTEFLPRPSTLKSPKLKFCEDARGLLIA